MRRNEMLILLFAAGGVWAQSPEPGKVRDVLTGDMRGSAANNAVCKMFTPAEIGAFLGAAVGAGQNAAGGAGCQWVDKDFEVQAIVTVVDPTKFEEPSLVKGFKRLSGIGKKAWVAPDSGWRAGALFDDAAVFVNLDGKKVNEASTTSFLNEAIKRRKK